MIGEIMSLQRAIEDDKRRCDIEVLCTPVQEDGHIERNTADIRASWYDSANPLCPSDAEFINAAMRYLDARGLLQRHPQKHHWVRHKTGCAPCAATAVA